LNPYLHGLQETCHLLILVIHAGLTYSCLHVYLGTLIDPISGKVLLVHACTFLTMVE
jgi:hypothetical protein